MIFYQIRLVYKLKSHINCANIPQKYFYTDISVISVTFRNAAPSLEIHPFWESRASLRDNHVGWNKGFLGGGKVQQWKLGKIRILQSLNRFSITVLNNNDPNKSPISTIQPMWKDANTYVSAVLRHIVNMETSHCSHHYTLSIVLYTIDF